MNTATLLYSRITRRYQRVASDLLARRPLKMDNKRPMISFTFDDFPVSALLTAGGILESNGIAGTYYASFGLMGRVGPTGEIFTEQHVPLLLRQGHELGCHTFAHCHATETAPDVFEQSILQNGRALAMLAPGISFKSLSYPIGPPRPETKRRSRKYFSTCRGGGQIHNSGTLDLNRLSAFFLEQSRDKPGEVEAVINANVRDCGWLIFATHDVCCEATRFGCTPSFFESVVRWARNSGAELLSVSAAYERLIDIGKWATTPPQKCGTGDRC